MHWTAALHHDGSVLYVSDPYPKLGDTVTLQLRAPLDAPILRMVLRSDPDGEAHTDPMQIIETDAAAAYWAADFQVRMPLNTYRFYIITPDGSYTLNARGVSSVDEPSFYDFKLIADYAAPRWVHDAVFYQVFPDRFHNGDPALTVKPGAWTSGSEKTGRLYSVTVRDWDEQPQPWAITGNLEFFGGDLPGITQKLDLLAELGVNALYINPVFTSPSYHRYNTSDFFNVDPHLGGNGALAALRETASARGIRIILDVTPNHTGATHPWFTAARHDENADTADFYTFHQRPDDYERWLGVRSLPKLNYASQRLRDRMYRDPDSVLQYWMRPPYSIDGWRLDVANMTARQGAQQHAAEVWQEARQALKALNPESYIMGEHFFDGTPYLQGDQLDAVMNYQGFTFPVWRWLSGYIGTDAYPDLPPDIFQLPAEGMAQQMCSFMAGIPYAIVLQQFNLLGSHDTARILSICKDDLALLKLAVGLLMTFPGVPSIYYGDEVGLAGRGDSDNRRPMPWDDSMWDIDLRAYYRQLIVLRKESSALKTGSFQVLHAKGDVFAFQRQSLNERVIAVAHRGAYRISDFALPVGHGGLGDGAILEDQLSGQRFQVIDGHLRFNGLGARRFYVLQVAHGTLT